MFPRTFRSFVFTLLALVFASAFTNGAAPRLKISENKRFLVTQENAPFFWLGDTAWELFHRLDRQEAERYLKTRAEQRFTVIQAVLLAELDGLREPNANGDRPLVDNDPARPSEPYFAHVDWIVKRANDLGLIMALLPTWGDKVGATRGAGPQVFTPENARIYGEFLGKRYKDASVVWVIGGDRPTDDENKRAIWRAMAAGLRSGDGGTHLVTYHPNGGAGSTDYFPNDDPLLDFNMRQNGHGNDVPAAAKIAADYARTPIKPVLDGEPLYEDHPIHFKPAERGYSNAADIRRFLYWDLFAGAFGHTYGNHSVWQMHDAKRGKGVNNPISAWHEALPQPGATQLQHARALIESRPFLTRVPDNSLIVPSNVPNATPGAGTKLIVATRNADGAYAMIYVPASRPFTVNLDKLSGQELRGWWFNPRTGTANERLETFQRKGAKEFTPPDKGENIDWVLVLDDVSKNFPPPGGK